MAEVLALPTSDHRISGSNLAGGEVLSKPKQRFFAQSPSHSPFCHPDMTEILLKRMNSPKPSIVFCRIMTEIDLCSERHDTALHRAIFSLDMSEYFNSSIKSLFKRTPQPPMTRGNNFQICLVPDKSCLNTAFI